MGRDDRGVQPADGHGRDGVTRGAAALVCAGCGAPQPDVASDPYPFRCVRAGELPDVDHVVARTLGSATTEAVAPESQNPFVRYRQVLYSYHVAREQGLSDAQYVDLVMRLDEAVAGVDGRRFTVTPLHRFEAVETALGIEPPGALWIKDETRNVAGSHKARHLMGVMIYLRVLETLGLDDPRRRSLAIASCGNAALAAAVIARAVAYPLRVFVPATAGAGIIDRIKRAGAHVEVCSRQPGTQGDPSYVRFRQAVAEGALPFCCQGNENGLTIEGGETLALEIVDALSAAGTPSTSSTLRTLRTLSTLGTSGTSGTPGTPGTLDRVFVQVGGGALASACIQAFTDRRAVGRITRLPRFHAVQTRGAFPLKRAYDRVRERIAANPRGDDPIGHAMGYARAHRSAFMWPWEVEPRSVAHGILDDETYDWAAVVEGTLRSGGHPIVVDEKALEAANALARAKTSVDVDHTGSAGVAGLMHLLRINPSARREQIAVIFSGVRRPPI